MIYRSKPKPVTENTVEKSIIDFMQACGWRVTRNHVGKFRPLHDLEKIISIGKEGFPDWTFTRGFKSCYGRSEMVHVEVKKPGKKPKPVQYEVIASLNHMNELAIWADSLEMFTTLYYQYFHD